MYLAAFWRHSTSEFWVWQSYVAEIEGHMEGHGGRAAASLSVEDPAPVRKNVKYLSILTMPGRVGFCCCCSALLSSTVHWQFCSGFKSIWAPSEACIALASITPTYWMHLPLKSSLSGGDSVSPASGLCCCELREGKGRRVPAAGPVVCGGPREEGRW